jgi:hypothetical protein
MLDVEHRAGSGSGGWARRDRPAEGRSRDREPLLMRKRAAAVCPLPPGTFGPSVLSCGGSALFDDAFEAIELADLVVHGPLHHRAHEPLETAQVGVEIEADAGAAFGG